MQFLFSIFSRLKPISVILILRLMLALLDLFTVLVLVTLELLVSFLEVVIQGLGQMITSLQITLLRMLSHESR